MNTRCDRHRGKRRDTHSETASGKVEYTIRNTFRHRMKDAFLRDRAELEGPSVGGADKNAVGFFRSSLLIGNVSNYNRAELNEAPVVCTQRKT